MRTVHENEALRPTESTSKHHTAGAAGSGSAATSAKPPRIKLKLSQPSKEGSHDSEKNELSNGSKDLNSAIQEFGPELGFDEHELSLDPEQLCRLLRRQIHWAEQEALQLNRNWNVIEPQRKEAWKEKELIFDDVLDAELRVFKSAVSPEDFGAGSASKEAATTAT